MDKFKIYDVAGEPVIVYTAANHMSDPSKQSAVDKLAGLFPNVKIIATFEDDTILTHNPTK